MVYPSKISWVNNGYFSYRRQNVVLYNTMTDYFIGKSVHSCGTVKFHMMIMCYSLHFCKAINLMSPFHNISIRWNLIFSLVFHWLKFQWWLQRNLLQKQSSITPGYLARKNISKDAKYTVTWSLLHVQTCGWLMVQSSINCSHLLWCLYV